MANDTFFGVWISNPVFGGGGVPSYALSFPAGTLNYDEISPFINGRVTAGPLPYRIRSPFIGDPADRL